MNTEKETERRIAKTVADFAGLANEETMDEYAYFDGYLCCGGERVAIIEVKGRDSKYRLGRLRTMMVDAFKVERMLEQSRIDGLPAVIVQEFGDGIFYYWLKAEDFLGFNRVERGGRIRDRRYPKDVKPVYFIPIEKCKKLRVKNEKVSV